MQTETGTETVELQLICDVLFQVTKRVTSQVAQESYIVCVVIMTHKSTAAYSTYRPIGVR